MSKPIWLDMMPVVPRKEVIERQIDVLRAVADYHGTCASLFDLHRRKSLPSDWDAHEHGDGCRFENRRTNQVVEARFEERNRTTRVDPYFFALFVRSTPGHNRVLEMIKEDFHDAARILEVSGM